MGKLGGVIESGNKAAVYQFIDGGRDPFTRARLVAWSVDYYRDGERVADGNNVWHEALPTRKSAVSRVRTIVARHLRNNI